MSRLQYSDGAHRYRLDGRAVPSVTGCLKVLAKDALVQWAANQAADLAVDMWDDLAAMPLSQRRAMIAGAHRRRRDRAAARGTQIHAWAEDLLAGRPVEIPDEHTATVTGFARWWEHAGFTDVVTEVAVFSDEDEYAGTAYAGRFDAIAMHPRWGRTLIDWKTGKGVYSEFAVQLAGYAAAEWHQLEDVDWPAPLIDTLAVAHIHPDGTSLHVLDREQRTAAADRWALVRGLASTPEPAFKEIA